MHRPLVLLFLAATACSRAPKQHEAGGVSIEERSDSYQLKGGPLNVFVSDPPSSLSIAPWPDRPPFAIEVIAAGQRRRLIDRGLSSYHGAAAIRHRIEGIEGELLLTIENGTIVFVARASKPERLAIQLGVARTHPIVLDTGGPYEAGEVISARSGFAVLGTTVIASPTQLTVTAEKTLTAIAAAETAELRVAIATAPTTREASQLGARFAKIASRPHADVLLDTGGVPARVWIEGARRVAGPPIAFDPSREAEPNTPIVDVALGRQVISLPEGKWTFRATRGLGFSVVRQDLEVVAGDALRVKLPLVEETKLHDWIGCDFHVHARPSFDATAVSYPDRVRSLVAVGVECAAATEHDHVGDHGPAAAELHLDDRFRALTGVELTTVAGGFGHFNVYPWPIGAAIPVVGATTPHKLFDAVRALPGSFVFQVNHPRMRNTDVSIGYFDFVGLNAKTGVAKGPYGYRHDYDAIEIFNGYDLRALPNVRALALEWLELLDRGEVHVATGSSDSHGISFPWAGFPRTLVRVGAAWRSSGRPIEAIVDALKKGRAYVSSGPLLELRADDATLGDTVAHPAKVRLTIAKTSWLGPPEVELRLGTEVAKTPEPRAEGDAWVIETTLAAPTRKRALVAIVESPLIGEALGLTGFERAMAITNPIWITP